MDTYADSRLLREDLRTIARRYLPDGLFDARKRGELWREMKDRIRLEGDDAGSMGDDLQLAAECWISEATEFLKQLASWADQLINVEIPRLRSLVLYLAISDFANSLEKIPPGEEISRLFEEALDRIERIAEILRGRRGPEFHEVFAA